MRRQFERRGLLPLQDVIETGERNETVDLETRERGASGVSGNPTELRVAFSGNQITSMKVSFYFSAGRPRSSNFATSSESRHVPSRVPVPGRTQGPL